MDRSAGAAQPRHFLAVNAGEQADSAVGLLLALQREVVLGDVYKELAQQLRQRRKGHAAADAEPDQWTQQPRQRRMQLRRGVRLVRGRFRNPGFGGHGKLYRSAAWDTIPLPCRLRLTCEIFPRINKASTKGKSTHVPPFGSSFRGCRQK